MRVKHRLIDISRYISALLKTFLFKIDYFYLHVKNLILRRKLVVSDVWCPATVVVRDCPVQIYWNTYGCHKVEIENIGFFRGASQGAILNIADNPSNLILHFYGTDQVIERKIQLKEVNVQLFNSFKVETLIPQLFKTNYTNKNVGIFCIDAELKEAIRNWMPSRKFTNIKFGLGEISLSIDSFEQINRNQS